MYECELYRHMCTFFYRHMCVRLFICIIIYVSILYYILGLLSLFITASMFLDSRFVSFGHSIIILIVQSYHYLYVYLFY